MLNVGDIAPVFSLPDSTGTYISSSDFEKLILYFYPKDDTPGCTTEACEFRDAWDTFQKQGFTIIGISTDSVQSHTLFKNKYSLPFYLLSDESKETSRAYGVWAPKKFMGKEYLGIIRTTFILEKGVVSYIFTHVSPKGHAQDVVSRISRI